MRVNLNEERHSKQRDTIRRSVIRSIRAQNRAVSDVAKTAGISRVHLHGYLANRKDMSGELLGRLFKSLRIHVCRTYDGKPVEFESFRKIVTRQIEVREWEIPDLAEQSGCHKSCLYRYLKGEKDMTGRKLSGLLTVLGFSFHANTTPPPVPREWLDPIDSSC